MSSVDPIERFFVELDGLWGGANPTLVASLDQWSCPAAPAEPKVASASRIGIPAMAGLPPELQAEIDGYLHDRSVLAVRAKVALWQLTRRFGNLDRFRVAGATRTGSDAAPSAASGGAGMTLAAPAAGSEEHKHELKGGGDRTAGPTFEPFNELLDQGLPSDEWDLDSDSDSDLDES